MLFTAVEARRVQYDKLTENDTVVAVAHDFPAAIETILQVLPHTKMIAVVNGASPNEMFWQGELRARTRAIERACRTEMVQPTVIRRHSERRSKSSASQRHLLAPDECRCGRRCARGQYRAEQALFRRQRSHLLLP